MTSMSPERIEANLRRRTAGPLCRVCGWRSAKVRGRCATCDTYRRRTGRDRPEERVVAHAQRLEQREKQAADRLFPTRPPNQFSTR